jgi:hypothetical protein
MLKKQVIENYIEIDGKIILKNALPKKRKDCRYDS